MIDPRYPSLDYEDLLPIMSAEEQEAMMKRKLAQLAAVERKQVRKRRL